MDLLGGYGSDDSSEGDATETQRMAIPAVQPPPNKSSISRHGRKLVSLHAVLPPHLFELLTNGGGDSDDDDPTDTPKRPEVKPSHPSDKRGADAGLTSLLSELGSVPKNAFSGMTSTSAVSKRETMGLAFSQSQTCVTSKTSQAAVLDIHGETMDYARYDEGRGKIVAEESVPAMNASKGPAPTSLVQLSVPRPTSFRATVHESKLGAPKVFSDTPYAVPGPIDQSERVEQSMDPRLEKKRSRREIEKALRSGDLDAIDNTVQFTNLDAESNVYVLDQPASATQSKSGVRIAPVAMYDTKAGKDVLGAGVSGKAKSKNQINFLMASAAAYEANEAQKTRVKAQRANAKRKYGW
jgi:hypothetical protein